MFKSGRKTDDRSSELFKVRVRSGGAFEAWGRLPGVVEGDAVPRNQRFREHFLYCDRLRPAGDGGPDAVLPPNLHADEPLLLRLLSYERRELFRKYWAITLFGEPTHRMRLGYYLQGDDRARYILDSNFCFLLPDVKAFSNQTSLKVCDYLSYLLFYQGRTMLRAELTRTRIGKTFWYVAIERAMLDAAGLRAGR